MKYTINQLSTVTNIPAATIRAWIMKPETGVAYSSDSINYKNLREKLAKYFPDEKDFEKFANCKINEVEIIKSEKVKNEYVKVSELEVNQNYIIHNYSLKTSVMYLGKFMSEDGATILFLFAVLDSKEELSYKAYSLTQLTKENMKIEKD